MGKVFKILLDSFCFMDKRLIIFVGVDGSGKSTYINMLIKDLAKKGLKAKRVWLRFNYFFTKPILLFCRIVGLTRREVRNGKTISIHDFHRSKFIAKTVQYLHFIDTCLAYFLKVYLPIKFPDKYILCDKFAYDILADFIVESKDLELLNKPIAKLFLKLVPHNSTVFFLKVDKEEIVRRKPEVLIDDEDFDLKYEAYRKLEEYFNFDLIDNNDLLEKVYPIILEKVGL